MRLLGLCALLCALCGLSAQAQEKPVGALTPAEIAKGWVRLFDGETTFGWTERGEAKWTVADGTLEASGGAGMLCTNTEFADFELRADCWVDALGSSALFLRAPVAGEINGQNAYQVTLYDAHKGKTKAQARIVGKWTALIIRAEGDHLTILADGQKALDTHDKKHRRGVLGLQYGGMGSVRFRNIALRPLGEKSVFNGKDLTGWKAVPGHKSVYTVTPEGWLNVKNGNGDLQSEEQWADFTLQLDIFSNGDHLNSGVFFRVEPGAFWGGYESQVRNQWEGDDRTKAVDYGTGGLYNRQPARKVVSSDREWFTMTVMATGKHIAIWVNGYLTSDFTDNRPEDQKNARNGARTKAGVLGLQGHDPTTDLSFRNIRIVELPARE